ncbi:uncharacterized protein LOC126316832 [Schistocerca gregaria]|uniref:uncharacterized protein LOC126316832 n=1 Tax=Schistocerca gregaria TaxID=7010 RepID=UPI00211E26F7|nr:uncharacterized protein LOC126316832 [Schistocerca gregaria]
MSTLDEDLEYSKSDNSAHDQSDSDAEDDSYDGEYEDSEEDEEESGGEQTKGRRKRRKLESKNSFVITEAEENEEEDEEDEDGGAEGDVEGFLESTEALEAEKEYQPRPELYRRARRDDLDDVESTIDYIKQRYQEQKEEESLDELEESGALDDDVAWMAKVPEKGGPMLWLVRCKKGKERELALNLMAKYLLNRQSKNPLLIYSVICQDHLKGSVYVEAQRESHVVTAIAGIPHLLQKKLTLVSLDEMPSVLKSLKHRVPKVGDWRRVNRGLYQGDIAQVVDIEEGGSGKVTICVVPRIDVGEWIKS